MFERYAKKTGIDTSPFFQYVISKLTIVAAHELPAQICEDPDDDMFIACAYAAEAPFIVTGDKKLLAAAKKAVLKILQPADFLQILKAF